MDISNIDITTLGKGYKNGDYKVADVISEYKKNIADKNDDINAFLEIFADVDQQVERAQKMIDEGNAMLMTGVPVAIKDNILIKDHISSASSHMLDTHKATYDADVITTLKEQGAILLGRTNMDEFAMGSSTETSYFGNTKNPVNTEHVPGGSSGGSAASIAMGGAMVALGSDTGGSVRQPASFCGVVGLCPTYGSVSRHGLMAMASSLDVIGPITKSVADAEIVFNTIGKPDTNDATCISQAIRDEDTTSGEVKKVGVPRSILAMDGIDSDVLENFEASLKVLRAAGYEIVDIELPLITYALPIYYIIQPAEASSNLARYDGVRYGLREDGEDLIDTYKKSRSKGFGKEVQRRILLGTYVLSHGYYDAYYNKATKLRKKLRMEFDEIFKQVDIVLTPTTPSTAFKFGEKSDPVAMYMSDIFTVPANIANIPALSVPSGNDVNGLPYGLHMIAPHLGEAKLFTLGKDFESRV